MTRYRSRGGFCRLTTLPGALSMLRMALLALSMVCVPFSPAAAAAMLALSLLAGLAARTLIHRYDQGDVRSRMLHILAGGLTPLPLLAWIFLKWNSLRFPACILLALGLTDCIRRCLRFRQPALSYK